VLSYEISDGDSLPFLSLLLYKICIKTISLYHKMNEENNK
jgi:hypothetical protein